VSDLPATAPSLSPLIIVIYLCLTPHPPGSLSLSLSLSLPLHRPIPAHPVHFDLQEVPVFDQWLLWVALLQRFLLLLRRAGGPKGGADLR